MATATMLNADTLWVIRRLLHVNNDSIREFESASTLVGDPILADYLQRCGDERNGFAAELAAMIETNGDHADSTGTARGMLHRWWLDIRGTIQQGNDRVILSEVERGQELAVRAYQDSVERPVDPHVREVLTREFAAVRTAHDRIRAMRNATPERVA